MITETDDFFCHQTIEPHAHVSVNDLSWADRAYQTLSDPDRFGIDIGVSTYPNRGLFHTYAIAAVPGKQWSLRATRDYSEGRWELRAGPIEARIIEPMQRWSYHCAPNESGISFDLEFEARNGPYQIDHTHSPHATARSFDPEPLVIETEERTYFDLDRIEVAEAAPAGSEELAQAAVEALGHRPMALLSRHGVIGVGHDPHTALDICCLAEQQALITDLVQHSAQRAAAAEPAVRTRVRLPITLAGGEPIEADIFTFTGLGDGREHIALGLGPYADVAVPLVRPHSECLTGDLLGSARCDCGPQLQEAIRQIHTRGGYLLYLRQEGRGIGLYNKLDAYALQDNGLDTYEANFALGLPEDARDYEAAAEMLRALGATTIDLLTNNPDKVEQLQAHRVLVRAVHTTSAFVTSVNARYLQAKSLRASSRS